MDLTHLSWPFFDAGNLQLAQQFAHWAEQSLSNFENEEGGDGRVARQLFEAFGKAGWLRTTLPEAQSPDSLKVSLRNVSLLREISSYSSAMADVALSEPWLGILPIALYGSAEMKEELLPRYVAGELLPAFALSEPDAGSDAAAITTTARREGDYFVINGRKSWTSNCGLADVYVVFARMEQSDGGGFAAFVVDGHQAGIAVEQRLAVLPPHTVGIWTLKDCRVPLRRRIGESGQGFAIAMKVLELFRPTVGAATLGFARRAMHEAVSRSRQRTAFKKPISEHQLIQAKLADMAVSVDAAALLVYRAAWLHDTTARSISREAAIAKLYSSEAAFEVIDEALQIFGGMGVVQGTAVERLFRHSRAFRIFDGTSEIQKLIIARNVLQAE
jgi:acyl-CoA dehydrogenase